MFFEERTIPTETFNLGIDSTFRDVAKYPASNKYVIVFDNVFKDVISVQLVFAVYEKNGIEPYVNLDIEELSPNLISNSQYLANSFCQLPLLEPLNTYNTSLFKCIKTFEKPLAKLSRLSIKFLKPDGSEYPIRDHFLKFEIKCMKFSGGSKEWRNNEVVSEGFTVFEPRTTMQQNKQTQHNQQSVDISFNPRAYLNVPDVYDVDMLKTAFKSALDVLQHQGLDPVIYDIRYKQIKEAFRILLERI